MEVLFKEMLTLKTKSGVEFCIDDEDYDDVIKHKWRFDKSTGYIIRVQYLGVTQKKEKYKKIYLHRYLMRPELGFVVDHINRNKLDNRRENLRQCSQRFNCYNSRLSKNSTSGFRGVSWNKSAKKWSASITADRKKVHLGVFANKMDAISARVESEKAYLGEFYYYEGGKNDNHLQTLSRGQSE